MFTKSCKLTLPYFYGLYWSGNYADYLDSDVTNVKKTVQFNLIGGCGCLMLRSMNQALIKILSDGTSELSKYTSVMALHSFFY